MLDIEEYLEDKSELVDRRIKKFIPETFTKEYSEWAFGKGTYRPDLDALTKSLSEPVWDFLNRGGKRWRPALFMLISEALGSNLDDVMDFAIIPELTHNGSIMVDDIEDGGELRRGKPCTHRIFGVDVALNAGNFMYVIPTLAFIKNSGKFKSNIMINAYNAFMQEMINIHLGQAMDIRWHKGRTKNISEENYLQMCAYKTGTLARMSARLAVIFAGGTDEQEKILGDFAEGIGVAFQIQDDVLSASGTEFAKKKGFGDDITEGKRTLIVLHALEHLPEEEGRRLNEILGMHTRDESLIKEALELLRKEGSIEYARKRSREIMQVVWDNAKNHIPESDAKKKLESFARFLIEREI